MRLTVAELAIDSRDAALELRRLCEGDLRGMFDGATTVRPDFDAPLVVLDLSAIYGTAAMPLLMICATTWLHAALTAPGQHRYVLIDEAWALLQTVSTARWLQASYKLCRQYGVANIAAIHRLSDLSAAGADGTEQRELAKGLLADAETRVIYRQAPGEIAAARELLGLTDTEAALIPTLPAGVALWRVGGRSFVVEHRRAPRPRNDDHRHRREDGFGRNHRTGGVSTPFWLGPHGQPPGHRPPTRTGPGSRHSDDDLWLYLVAILAGVFIALGLLVWSAGQLAALATRGAWPRVPASAAFGIVLRLPAHVPAPAAAWPRAARAQLAGPAAFYTVLTVEFVILAFAAAAIAHRVVLWRAGARRRVRDRSLHWARPAQLRHLLVTRPQRGRLFLGRLGSRRVAAEPRASVLVVAPSQWGKTFRVVVPNLLAWTGPTLITSVKADVITATIARRLEHGHVQIFDPTGATRYQSAHWSPLLTSGTYEAAERTASWLVQAAGDHDNVYAKHWEQLGARLLGPMLFAAAGTDTDMRQVARWVDRRADKEVTEILERLGDDDALDAWTATAAREDRAKDSVYGTAEHCSKRSHHPPCATRSPSTMIPTASTSTRSSTATTPFTSSRPNTNKAGSAHCSRRSCNP